MACGWMPFVAGRFDNEWELKDLWERNLHERVPNLPSSYIPGRIYGCIFDDLHGLRCRDEIGRNHILFEGYADPGVASTVGYVRDGRARIVIDPGTTSSRLMAWATARRTLRLSNGG